MKKYATYTFYNPATYTTYFRGGEKVLKMEVEKMSKMYRYKGYDFWRTDITTDKIYKMVDRDLYKTKKVYVYQVNGFNPRQRPFLTSIKECKEFIDELEEKRRWYN